MDTKTTLTTIGWFYCLMIMYNILASIFYVVTHKYSQAVTEICVLCLITTPRCIVYLCFKRGKFSSTFVRMGKTHVITSIAFIML